MQVPVQAVLQQTPCAQKPDWQAEPAVQVDAERQLAAAVAGAGVGRDAVGVVVQVVLQAPVPHSNGSHICVVAGPAAARAVAGPRRGERRAGAGGRARRSFRPGRTGRRPRRRRSRWCRSVGAPSVGALVQRIAARPGRPCRCRCVPVRSHDHAGAVAGGVAADALRAVPEAQSESAVQVGAGRLLAADAAVAEVARRAVGVDGAARLADAGRVADVRRCTSRSCAGLAGPRAVALAGRRGEAGRAGVRRRRRCPTA